MRRGYTLLELLVAGIVIAALVAILLPIFNRSVGVSKRTGCINHLAQLWKMQHHYMAAFGGAGEKAMPRETGSAFWLRLATTQPPMIDATMEDLFRCPVLSQHRVRGACDYRGPASDVNRFQDGDVVGADAVGNHGAAEGGNVLLMSGDVQTASRDHPLWLRAASSTHR
jgi:prepilin-type N-terminal cleavage/methylation domain-containing protein